MQNPVRRRTDGNGSPDLTAYCSRALWPRWRRSRWWRRSPLRGRRARRGSQPDPTWRRQQGVPGRSRRRRPDLHLQWRCVEFRRAARESVRRQRQADHHALRRPELAGQGRQQVVGRRPPGHRSTQAPFPGCSSPPRRLRPIRRRPARAHDLHPAARHHRRPHAAPPQTATRQRQTPWSRSPTPRTTSSGSSTAPDSRLERFVALCAGGRVVRPPAGRRRRGA